ncbi:MAG: hypothetical protein M3Q71_23540, partial [Chloroflexota bacterium]|nr:hypothetical protein [Chloroflexota bacterium]
MITSDLLDQLGAGRDGRVPHGVRRLLARAQPYLVLVRQRLLDGYMTDGLVSSLVGDVWLG